MFEVEVEPNVKILSVEGPKTFPVKVLMSDANMKLLTI